MILIEIIMVSFKPCFCRTQLHFHLQLHTALQTFWHSSCTFVEVSDWLRFRPIHPEATLTNWIGLMETSFVQYGQTTPTTKQGDPVTTL